MSDQNTAAQDQGTETAKLYATKAEAEAAKPTEGKKRLFAVAKDGGTRWVWANGYDNSLALVARSLGYTVSQGSKSAPVTKEAVVAKLAEFSDDELAALGLSRKPAKGGKK
jgi:hypothetical protein